MRILLDMGHCLSGADTGAQGNGFKEQDCTREIGYKVKAKLEALGHTVIVCNCDSSNSVGESLAYRVNKANSSGGDVYISIHLNAGGGVGTEVYTYGAKYFTEVDNVLNSIVSLGYTNRGIKDGSGLYVIRNTNMKAMLVECCFIDSSDMQKYNPEAIANAIVKGLTGQTVAQTPTNSTEGGVDVEISDIQWKLNWRGYGCKQTGIMDSQTIEQVKRFQNDAHLEVDGIPGPITLKSLNCYDFKAYTVKIEGIDIITAKKVVEVLKKSGFNPSMN